MNGLRTVLTTALVLALHFFDGQAPAVSAAARPNILWISCEDIGPHLGCYDHPQATTPTLDRLAAEGVRYTNASTVAGVCAICRASIITGMYPSTLGNQFMRCRVDLPAHVALFPQLLRDAGYYCTNNSKTDYNITGNHGRCWDESSNKAHWRNRSNPDQPFFAVFNFTNTHESKVFNYSRPKSLSDAELHDPAKVELPPYYPDTAVTRADWAHYLDNITAMDKLAADVLSQLAEDGLADNTIVIFWSDHGAGLPRNKRWLYDSGVEVPLIVRIPERLRVDGQGTPSTVSDELISIMDLAATTLNLAGVPIPDHMHSRPFLGEHRAAPRQLLHLIRDRMDERYDMVRGVRTARYRYLRNYQAYQPYAQVLNYMEQEHTMQELRRLFAAGQLNPIQARFLAKTKPYEELYDLQEDPHEIHNLIDVAADDRELSLVLGELRAAHENWALETRDTGLIPEAELQQRAAQVGSRWAILQQENADQLLLTLMHTNRVACNPHGDQSVLLQAAQHADAAVRYWALIGLGNQLEVTSVNDTVLATLRAGLRDESGSVRVAAARGLWLADKTSEALDTIRTAALSNEEFLSLQAVHLIDDMDDDAAGLLPVVKQVHDRGQEYPTRVAKYLLGLPTK
ncbi:MAG: sulfatase-like hydrolase/transferase [Planctomycetales bacterium]|nr:sulfatase-like hydrolase/transferase [Planctomycetales bacterium]